MNIAEKNRLLEQRLAVGQNLYDQDPLDIVVQEAQSQHQNYPDITVKMFISFWSVEMERLLYREDVVTSTQLDEAFAKVDKLYAGHNLTPKLKKLGVQYLDITAYRLAQTIHALVKPHDLLYRYVAFHIGHFRGAPIYSPGGVQMGSRYKVPPKPATFYRPWLEVEVGKRLIGLNEAAPRMERAPIVTPGMQGTIGQERYFRQRRTIDTHPRSTRK